MLIPARWHFLGPSSFNMLLKLGSINEIFIHLWKCQKYALLFSAILNPVNLIIKVNHQTISLPSAYQALDLFKCQSTGYRNFANTINKYQLLFYVLVGNMKPDSPRNNYSKHEWKWMLLIYQRIPTEFPSEDVNSLTSLMGTFLFLMNHLFHQSL